MFGKTTDMAFREGRVSRRDIGLDGAILGF